MNATCRYKQHKELIKQISLVIVNRISQRTSKDFKEMALTTD